MKCKVSTLSIGFLSLVMLFSANAVTPTERQYLVDFYNSTDGDNWTNTQAGTNVWDINNPVSDPCTWHGIACDVTGEHVTSINIGGNNLSGELPEGLNALTGLVGIDINNNQLTGKLPNLSGLVNLKSLTVSDNQFSGSIPASFLELTNLTDFNAENNQFNGTLPEFGNHLPNLNIFSVSYNQLTGRVPDLNGLTMLTTFYIGGNQLEGELPPAPQSLIDNQLPGVSTVALCPGNPFIRTPNSNWDAVTHDTPWWKGDTIHGGACASPRPGNSATAIPVQNGLGMLSIFTGLLLLALSFWRYRKKFFVRLK